MGAEVIADFSGYATKAGIKCTDGRTIMPDAFKHMDKVTVPLVWQHGHDTPKNVLGHAVLEARPDGLYAYGFFNETDDAQHAKVLVQHNDITKLSIWANQLVERAKQVFHGMVREVSLVMAGANREAVIDNVNLQHSDDPNDTTLLDDEYIIAHMVDFDFVNTNEEAQEDALAHATAQEVYDTLTDEQKDLVHFLIGAATEAKNSAEHSDGPKADDDKSGDKEDHKPDEGELSHKEGTTVVTNVFDKTDDAKTGAPVLSHDAMKSIFESAKRGGSLKHAVMEYAEKNLQHGIESIDVLFPDAKTLTSTPEFNKRRTEWVAGVLGAVRHTPFSKVKSIVADITMDAARALGYIKGNFKKSEWFSLTKRTTAPTTVYKKQQLDRDDIVDITDFDVVSWMKGEMRLMLDEELATAILIGDGRETDDDDKIKDPVGAQDGIGIRSILNDNELYTSTAYVNIADSSSSYYEVFEALLRQRKNWRGTGQPTLYTTNQHVVEFLLTKDAQNRRYWMSKDELASALNVAAIVEVETMERVSDLVGILVNLQDYNVGTDRGGEINLFDDFDLDYNLFKYLMETRMSGALVKIKSALVIRSVASTKALVYPITAPTMDPDTYVVTIPTQTGVTYKNADTSATISAGAMAALDAGDELNVIAVADSTHYFADNVTDEWHFERPSA